MEYQIFKNVSSILLGAFRMTEISVHRTNMRQNNCKLSTQFLFEITTSKISMYLISKMLDVRYGKSVPKVINMKMIVKIIK